MLNIGSLFILLINILEYMYYNCSLTFYIFSSILNTLSATNTCINIKQILRIILQGDSKIFIKYYTGCLNLYIKYYLTECPKI